MHPNFTPPIWPSGSNGIEARTKALEVAQAYDLMAMQAIREEMTSLRAALSDLTHQYEAVQRRAALWAISALLSAVAALVLILVKIKAPWLVTP